MAEQRRQRPFVVTVGGQWIDLARVRDIDAYRHERQALCGAGRAGVAKIPAARVTFHSGLVQVLIDDDVRWLLDAWEEYRRSRDEAAGREGRAA